MSSPVSSPTFHKEIHEISLPITPIVPATPFSSPVTPFSSVETQVIAFEGHTGPSIPLYSVTGPTGGPSSYLSTVNENGCTGNKEVLQYKLESIKENLPIIKDSKEVVSEKTTQPILQNSVNIVLPTDNVKKHDSALDENIHTDPCVIPMPAPITPIIPLVGPKVEPLEDPVQRQIVQEIVDNVTGGHVVVVDRSNVIRYTKEAMEEAEKYENVEGKDKLHIVRAVILNMILLTVGINPKESAFLVSIVEDMLPYIVTFAVEASRGLININQKLLDEVDEEVDEENCPCLQRCVTRLKNVLSYLGSKISMSKRFEDLKK